MGLLDFLRPKERAMEPWHNPRMACPECNSEHFVPGGPIVSVGFDGGLPWQSGTLVCCIKCGKRWAATARGLEVPHNSVLPQAWALDDLKRQLAREVPGGAGPAPPAKPAERRPDLPRKRSDQGFRRPPSPR